MPPPPERTPWGSSDRPVDAVGPYGPALPSFGAAPPPSVSASPRGPRPIAVAAGVVGTLLAVSVGFVVLLARPWSGDEAARADPVGPTSVREAGNDGYERPALLDGGLPVLQGTGDPLVRADGSVGAAPVTYTGSGNTVFDVDLGDGPVYVRASSDDPSDIGVYGPTEFTGPTLGSEDTRHEFTLDLPVHPTSLEATQRFSVRTDGPWTIEVLPYEEIPVTDDLLVEGEGPAVIRWAGPTGRARITVRDSGYVMVAVQEPDGPVHDLVFGNGGPVTTPVDWDEEGGIIKVLGDGAWSIEVVPE